MALSQSAVSELLEAFRAGEGVDLIRESVRLVLQELIETEAAEVIGAGRYERTPTRITDRNGARPRTVSTQAGDIGLRIPKLRKGSFFPAILEPRRRIDQALYAVVMEAYVHGVSTRSVDDLVAAMGIDSGISKSQVSRICAGLDEAVTAFRTLGHTSFPYVYLDATYLHVREDTHGDLPGQVVSKAVVIATGITATGGREVLGLAVGDSEEETFWRAFLTDLKARGLGGVRLVISDQHAGLVAALRRCFQGAGHQRCRVHFARNLFALIPKSHKDMVAARPRRGLRVLGRGPRPVGQVVPEGRPADGRRQGRGPGVHRVPPLALGQGVVEQSVGTDQQGGQTPAPRRGDLPERGLRHPPGRRRLGRRPRRMAGPRPPLLLRSLHGPTRPHPQY
jgi:putative transposase